MVRQNKGLITVSTAPGQGCTVEIYFPRHLSGTIQIAEHNRTQSGKIGSETILLVEDEPAILEVTTMMLEDMGYKVVQAKTPGEAIGLVKKVGGKIHLLMTDVIMPEMNDRNLAKSIQAICPELKCLFMSGYTANVIAHHGILDEGMNFIQKPFAKQDLSIKIREFLDAGGRID